MNKPSKDTTEAIHTSALMMQALYGATNDVDPDNLNADNIPPILLDIVQKMSESEAKKVLMGTFGLVIAYVRMCQEHNMYVPFQAYMQEVQEN